MKTTMSTTIFKLLLAACLLLTLVQSIENRMLRIHVEGVNMTTEDLSVTNAMQLQRRRLQETYASYLADGHESLYDDFAQAWRLLGLFVDCSDTKQQQGRNLAENNKDNSGSYGETCTRYLLWAAYVNADYQGGGLGEYELYDPVQKKWDKSACKAKGTKHCTKMDCHLMGSKFKLLGYYKQEYPIEFLQVLSSYSGNCLWNSDEEAFMSNYLDHLPQQCTATGLYNDREHKQQLYIHLKPKYKGKIDIGVYTDDMCSIEASGISTMKVVKDLQKSAARYDNYDQNGGNNDSGENTNSYKTIAYESINEFNTMLHRFQSCQPCRTYNPAFHPASDYMSDGNDPNNVYYSCFSSDGTKVDVNQCSMFAQTTSMKIASLRDVELARQQGAIVPVHVRQDSWWAKYGFLVFSILVFLVGLILFCRVSSIISNKQVGFSEPLLDSQQGKKGHRPTSNSR